MGRSRPEHSRFFNPEPVALELDLESPVSASLNFFLTQTWLSIWSSLYLREGWGMRTFLRRERGRLSIFFHGLTASFWSFQFIYSTWSGVALSQGSSPLSMATRTIPQDQRSAGSPLYTSKGRRQIKNQHSAPAPSNISRGYQNIMKKKYRWWIWSDTC